MVLDYPNWDIGSRCAGYPHWERGVAFPCGFFRVICAELLETTDSPQPPSSLGYKGVGFSKSPQIALCATFGSPSMQGLFARGCKRSHSSIWLANRGCSTKGRWRGGLIFWLPKIPLRSTSTLTFVQCHDHSQPSPQKVATLPPFP